MLAVELHARFREPVTKWDQCLEAHTDERKRDRIGAHKRLAVFVAPLAPHYVTLVHPVAFRRERIVVTLATPRATS
jgi:hypothetical protein